MLFVVSVIEANARYARGIELLFLLFDNIN